MSAEYRIVTDNCHGYTVQWRRWWWPFWTSPQFQSHRTVDEAERWAKAHSGEVVRDLGRVPNTTRDDA
jgi:hypothetical protein